MRRTTAPGDATATGLNTPGDKGLEFTSTRSEEVINLQFIGTDDHIARRKQKKDSKNRTLFNFLALTTTVSAILFLASFKIINSTESSSIGIQKGFRPHASKSRRHFRKREKVVPVTINDTIDSKTEETNQNLAPEPKSGEENAGPQNTENDSKIEETNQNLAPEPKSDEENAEHQNTENAVADDPDTIDTNTDEMQAPTHDAFVVIESKYLSTHQSALHIYSHKKTRAQFMAYIPKDDLLDKVFGISFRTKPTSNNGVAHILEHSVLCGSEKYPAKDPFLILQKGSLKTFLNAITYNDRTVYPVASRNKKDFQNLMSVYLDAVFAPKCVTEEGDWILKQEGWRYDIDESEKLELKGIVHSEMKGVYSNPLSMLSRTSDKFLFKNNTYHYDSGGDPSSIPTLTQEEFVDFYKRHYHPTNSQSFVSGTVEDVVKGMEAIDSYMKEYEYEPDLKKNSEIEYQKKFLSQREYEKIPYAVQKIDDSQGQHMLSITWLLNDSKLSPEEKLSLFILNYLLVGSSSAPLVKRLSESNLGKSVIGGGLSTGMLQDTFTIGMKGVQETNVAHVEALIFQILNDIVRDGFAKDEIEAAVNVVEFELREVRSSSTPAGIEIFLLVLSRWNYDQNPLESLEYEGALNEVKKAINEKQSAYFVHMIESFILNNDHRVHMELVPDESLSAKIIKEEKEMVQKVQANLKQGEFDAIKEKTLKLKKVQDSGDPPDVVSAVPHLEISDLDKSGAEYDIDVTNGAYGSSSLLTKHISYGSNGIVYIDVGIDISRVDYSDMQLLPFIVSTLYENDSRTHTRQELDNLIGMHTGGITIELQLLPIFEQGQTDVYASDNKKMRSMIFFRGKCVAQNTPHLLSLMTELIQSLPVPKEKAIQILERKISGYKTSISSKGHMFALKRLRSKYDTESFIIDKLTGIRQLMYLQSTLETATKDWDVIGSKISSVMKTFSEMRSTDTIINLTGDSETLGSIDKNIEEFVRKLKDDPDIPKLQNFAEVNHPWMEQGAKERTNAALVNEGVTISSRVSYVSKGGVMLDEGEKISGQRQVSLQYLKKGYLWENVRAKNGAYGVSAMMGSRDGGVFMVSYRDPKLSETIDSYDEMGKYLESKIDENAVTELTVRTAIMGTIGSLDGPSLPPNKAGWLAFRRFLGGSTKAHRQKWRDEILSTTVSDFKDFATRLQGWRNTSIVVLSSESALEEARKTIPMDVISIH